MGSVEFELLFGDRQFCRGLKGIRVCSIRLPRHAPASARRIDSNGKVNRWAETGTGRVISSMKVSSDEHNLGVSEVNRPVTPQQ